MKTPNYKFLLFFVLSSTIAYSAIALKAQTDYSPTSDYALGDIVPSSDPNILYYQAQQDLTGGSHSLSNSQQWWAAVSSDIPMGGNISTEPVPTETPGESAPTVISSSNPPTSDQTSFFDPTPIYSETQNTSLQSVNETMIGDLDNDGDLDIVYESMEGSFLAKMVLPVITKSY